jgi:hypothetical protein
MGLLIYPNNGKMRMYNRTAKRQIYADSNLEINQPAKGRETMDPIGKPIKIVPKAASERDRVSLKSGIRVAQVAKFNPHRKNKIPMEYRFLFMW